MSFFAGLQVICINLACTKKEKNGKDCDSEKCLNVCFYNILSNCCNYCLHPYQANIRYQFDYSESLVLFVYLFEILLAPNLSLKTIITSTAGLAVFSEGHRITQT